MTRPSRPAPPHKHARCCPGPVETSTSVRLCPGRSAAGAFYLGPHHWWQFWTWRCHQTDTHTNTKKERPIKGKFIQTQRKSNRGTELYFKKILEQKLEYSWFSWRFKTSGCVKGKIHHYLTFTWTESFNLCWQFDTASLCINPTRSYKSYHASTSGSLHSLRDFLQKFLLCGQSVFCPNQNLRQVESWWSYTE